jgi:phage FluMu protein Com
MQLQEIRCPHCNKFVCESSGEVKRKCERCKKDIHAQVTPIGVIYIGKDMPPNEIAFVNAGKVTKFVIK